ncbi:MAG: N-acyl homoserine lactonase family protein [Rhizobiaceae bacterium]|nr:N-acyl homoserine lactonase family protein [Rhizobiaceae bacterium]
MEKLWDVYALKYAERNTRTRADSFLFDDDHASPHNMDYFIWVLKSDDRVIVVDTGYDAQEAERRGRPILRDPANSLEAIGIRAEEVDTVIITHLHYDHAGGLDRYPNATFHLQQAEMAFATGPCMCNHVLQMPFTADHVCEMVQKVYSGRVIFHDGDGAVADGVTVHCVGGHSKGLQAVRVKTSTGYLCLASDASHYYENFLLQKPFPIVVDLPEMISGFKTIQSLASENQLVIPGHDPLVTSAFPTEGQSGFVWRLDQGPDKKIQGMS